MGAKCWQQGKPSLISLEGGRESRWLPFTREGGRGAWWGHEEEPRRVRDASFLPWKVKQGHGKRPPQGWGLQLFPLEYQEPPP